jgi:MYXO-CTERM domain-containing protein
LILGFGTGCGGGCAFLKPLPNGPAPLNFPTDQIIEGGIQARVTKPGMDKLAQAFPRLIKNALGSSQCVISGRQTVINADLCPLQASHLYVCDTKACPGNKTGCALSYAFNSADRPAPNNVDDGKDGVFFNLPDGTPAVLTVNVRFDINFPLHASYEAVDLLCNDPDQTCTLDVYSNHYTDNSATPIDITLKIRLDTDPTTGELTLHLDDLNINNLGVGSNGCGFVGDVLNALASFLNTAVGNFLTNLVADLLRPQIDALLQSLLPKPLGLAGTVDTAAMLASFSPPDNTNLEMFIVPGGYSSAKAGGLNLGVMSGMNSDRDQSTRTAGLTSEASLCVPQRPTPDLQSAPWMLPYNPPRKDFLLSPAGAFDGNPDPMDAMGNVQDVAIGLSRTFLDLAGFHIYNSGTMCLAIGGSAIPQLNAGTLSVIISSLGNIIDDRKAPLALVLRPQTPINFTIGAGTMMDALIHVAVQDLRIDFYAWIEERYVRLLTLGLDLNVGINLDVTKNAQMQPALAPTLIGLDASNITIRVSNTDLLQEKPDDLAKVFPSLLNIATGALGGAIPPVTLPAVAGFSLDDLKVQKVQTTQDDFVGIFATIKDGTPLGLLDWSNPNKPRRAEDIQTVAKLGTVRVPTAEQIHALFFPQPGLTAVTPDRPSVQLDLSTIGANGREVEFSWRLDSGMWRSWNAEPHPIITDDSLLLQGRHTIDVRSRLKGDWLSEDLTPERITVLIDSMAPELHPVRSDDKTQLIFGGFDIVSDDSALLYSWVDEHNQRTPWTSTDRLPVETLRAITNDGASRFQLFVKDEAGNIGQSAVDLVPMLAFHGRTTNPPGSGCNCDVGGGGGSGGGVWLVVLVALVCLRRKAAAPLLLIGSLVTCFSGCNSDAGSRCAVDDDCYVKLHTKCDSGQIPQCMGGVCGCTPDIPKGETGRFSSMQLIASDAYVSAYNTTYGDLMIGHVTPPGIVTNWDFVDGIPDDPPDVNSSHVRGGIMTQGDDVGRYTSIGATLTNEPVIAYYDKTHGALKFASFGVIRWHSHVVDKGATPPSADDGDDVGRWASLSMSSTGIPSIAYTAIVHTGTRSGMPESQLRWAQAKVKDPQQTSDWTILVLDARPLEVPPSPDPSASPAAAPDVLLPEGVALMASAARRSDDSPAVAYYDRVRGNLRYVEFVPSANSWSDPIILDGEDGNGNDTGDVGLYPSLTFDTVDVAHISYVNATKDDLLHIDSMNRMREVVDDGYRPTDEMTLDGLASPVFHLVGDSSSIGISGGKLAIAYQDSTIVTLRVALQDPMTLKWTLGTIAGHAMAPFKGSYGFYACLRPRLGNAVVASYAINQQMETPLYFVEVFAVDLGSIM